MLRTQTHTHTYMYIEIICKPQIEIFTMMIWDLNGARPKYICIHTTMPHNLHIYWLSVGLWASLLVCLPDKHTRTNPTRMPLSSFTMHAYIIVNLCTLSHRPTDILTLLVFLLFSCTYSHWLMVGCHIAFGLGWSCGSFF